MENLNRLLNKYLKTKTISPDEFVRAIEDAEKSKDGDLYQKLGRVMGADGLNQLKLAINALSELDIPVSSKTLSRDPRTRLEAIAKIAQNIEEATGQKEVPCISSGMLNRYPYKVALDYKEMLKEMYELAAFFEFMGTVLESGDSIPSAIKFWDHYLYYADGHPEQAKRIQLAKVHLKRLHG